MALFAHGRSDRRWANWPTACDGKSTAARLTSTSTAISIRPMFVTPTASSAASIARRGSPTPTRTTSTTALRVAGEAVNEGATELHITGGLNTKLPFSYFTDLLSVSEAAISAAHLKAFTMVEFDHFAHFYKMSDEDVIQQLIDAGLDSCPGGGAEIFREPTRSMICAHKCDADRWLELSGKVHARRTEDQRDDALRAHRVD